jgi:hypothetical protein
MFMKIYSGMTTLSNEEFGAIELDSSWLAKLHVRMISAIRRLDRISASVFNPLLRSTELFIP